MATETKAIEITSTGIDYFGCFGPIGQMTTTYYTPTATQVMGAMWLTECGHALDAVEQTIVDLCFAGV